MNTLKTTIIAVIAAVVVVSVGFWLVGSQQGTFGATIGASFFPHSGVGARSFKVVTSTTDNTPAPDGTIAIGGGSVSVLRDCNAVTYNPPSLASGATTTLAVSTPGAMLGDSISVTFATSTQGISLNGYVSSNGTTTVNTQNGFSGATIDLGTSTLNVCYTR